MQMRKKLLVLSTVVLTATAPAAFAGSVAGNGGATEVTQLLNNVELVGQTAQQIQMVQNQLTQLMNEAKNLTASPMQIWGQAQADLNQLAGLVQQGQSLSYAAQNIDQLFKQQFPGYSSTPAGANGGFSSKYQSWSRTALDSINSALNAAGMQASQFATERAAVQSIQGISAGSPGALQAIQAGNMIASSQVDQLQKLRQIMMSQQQAQASYMAYQVQQETNDRATMDAHFQKYVPTGGGWSSKGGKQ